MEAAGMPSTMAINAFALIVLAPTLIAAGLAFLNKAHPGSLWSRAHHATQRALLLPTRLMNRLFGRWSTGVGFALVLAAPSLLSVDLNWGMVAMALFFAPSVARWVSADPIQAAPVESPKA